MLVALGDLVEDVVVELAGPVNVASDTDARITRRRGGSAANVAAAAARLGASARFLGQVGDDPLGDRLLADLAALGVDVSCVRRGGRTGTIVVLVDAHGERTMLVDQGSARSLAAPGEHWLDGATALHVPYYSLVADPIADVASTLIGRAHDRGVAVSIDVSSVGVIEAVGVQRVLGHVTALWPDIVFANAHEADVLGLAGPLGESVTVVKRGPLPCVVHAPARKPVEVPPILLEHAVDTTGAGDAFAAGVLTHPAWRQMITDACASGHRAAHDLLSQRLA